VRFSWRDTLRGVAFRLVRKTVVGKTLRSLALLQDFFCQNNLEKYKSRKVRGQRGNPPEPFVTY
jgi:hypothetical protein